MDWSKADWKLFCACIGEWQETYIKRLNEQYIEILSGDGLASDKFWKLNQRIQEDKKNAQENGCTELRIDTNARNAVARAMYKKHGYTEIGIVPTVFNGIEGVQLVLLEKYLGK